MTAGLPEPWYIAGPMTGLPEFNRPAFVTAAAQLRNLGLRVLSPVEGAAHLGDDAAWADYLRSGIRQVLDARGVVVLPGWEASRGATLEVHVASRLGLDVVTLDELLARLMPRRTEAAR
jgi:hypothetical protein